MPPILVRRCESKGLLERSSIYRDAVEAQGVSKSVSVAFSAAAQILGRHSGANTKRVRLRRAAFGGSSSSSRAEALPTLRVTGNEGSPQELGTSFPHVQNIAQTSPSNAKALLKTKALYLVVRRSICTIAPTPVVRTRPSPPLKRAICASSTDRFWFPLFPWQHFRSLPVC